ncbi:MAG: tetratricopeptide repeat protein [Lentimicrobium sp.]
MYFPLILFGQSKVDFLFEKLKTSPDNPALLNELSEAMLENSATAADSLAMLALNHAKHKRLLNEEIRAIVNIYNAAWETSDYKKVIRFAEMATTLYLSVGNTVEAAGALNEAALASYEIDRYDQALRHYKRSVNILLKAGDNKNLPSVLTNMAQVYERKGESDSAVYYLTKSIGMSQLPGFEPELSAAYGNLGFVYKSMGNYSKALENYSAAYKISVAMDDEISMATDMNNIAAIYLHWKNYKMAGQYFKRALAIYESSRNLANAEVTMANLANVLQQEKKYDSALLLYKKSLKIAQELGREGSAAVKLSNIGMLFHQTGKSDSAIIYLKNSLETGRGLGRTYSVCSSLQNLGDVYLDKGDLESAQKYLLEALDCAESLKALPVLEKTYKSLSKFYEDSGKPGLALQAMKKYLAVNDSLFTIESNQKLVEMEALYENEIQQQQIELLLQKNQLTEARLDRNFIVLYGLAGGLAFLLIISVTITSLYIQKKKANQMLVRKNLEILKQEECDESVKNLSNQSPLNSEEKNRLIAGIARLIKEERIYTRKQLSLADLAKTLNTNTAYLSHLINDHYKTNFPNFLNKLRVQEAQKMLTREEYKNQTFEAIAESVGFHSRSAFNAAFKNITGVTPGFFIKNLDESNSRAHIKGEEVLQQESNL